MAWIEEAGGVFTDWSGRRRCDGPDIVVSNGKLHEATLAVLGPPIAMGGLT